MKPIMPKSLHRGELKLGDVVVPCHVLDTEPKLRVLTQRGVWSLLLPDGTAHGHFSRYITRIPTDGKPLQLAPTMFTAPNSPPAQGYEATALIDICTAYYEAWQKGRLQKSQIPIAQRATSILVACGKIGIIALVDEATGYQEVREYNELQIKVAAYLREEMREWSGQFPEVYHREASRVLGIPWKKGKNPAALGRFQREEMYDRILGEDVAAVLKEMNKDPKWGHNHHQFLEEFARKQLQYYINAAIALLKRANTWKEFKYNWNKDRPGSQVDWVYDHTA